MNSTPIINRTWIIAIAFSVIFFSLFVLYVYELRELLNPFIIGLILLFMLFPFRVSPTIRRAIVLITVITILYLIKSSMNVLIPIFISLLLAYLLDPLVDFFETRRIKRQRIILLLMLGLIFIIVTGLIFLIPVLVHEVQKLLEKIPQFKTAILNWIELAKIKLTEWGLLARLQEWGLLPSEIPIEQQLIRKGQQLIEFLLSGALTFGNALSGTISQLLNLILIPFLTYYFLVDFDRIKTTFIKIFPVRQQEHINEILQRFEKVVGLYVRGQVLVCLIIAVMTSLGLLLVGVDFALLFGTMAGIANLVPYIGLMVTLIIASIVTLVGQDPFISLFKLVFVFWAVQALEGTFISPRVVGKATGLNPAAVIIAVLVFANFFGFIGLLIAVPIAAVGKALIKEWYQAYTQSDFYHDSIIDHADGSSKIMR